MTTKPAQRVAGRNAIEVWIGYAQTQPELASGRTTSPPAGITLIQQPGRLTELSDRASPPAARSSTDGFPSRKNTHEAEAEIVPQPERLGIDQPPVADPGLAGSPVNRSNAAGSEITRPPTIAG